MYEYSRIPRIFSEPQMEMQASSLLCPAHSSSMLVHQDVLLVAEALFPPMRQGSLFHDRYVTFTEELCSFVLWTLAYMFDFSKMHACKYNGFFLAGFPRVCNSVPSLVFFVRELLLERQGNCLSGIIFLLLLQTSTENSSSER
jgi:hypothetical protein